MLGCSFDDPTPKVEYVPSGCRAIFSICPLHFHLKTKSYFRNSKRPIQLHGKYEKWWKINFYVTFYLSSYQKSCKTNSSNFSNGKHLPAKCVSQKKGILLFLQDWLSREHTQENKVYFHLLHLTSLFQEIYFPHIIRDNWTWLKDYTTHKGLFYKSAYW